jgi:hypothetical protein
MDEIGGAIERIDDPEEFAVFAATGLASARMAWPG